MQPNEIEHKYRFLENVIPHLQPFAWFGTLAQLGGWWAARDQLSVDVTREKAATVISLTSAEPIDGNRLLIRHLPAGTTRIRLE